MLAAKQAKAEEATKISYRIVKSTCKTDGAIGETVYGIEAFRIQNFNYSIFDDISANRHDVEKLLFLLNKGNVTPDQLKYIVEDYILELNS